MLTSTGKERLSSTMLTFRLLSPGWRLLPPNTRLVSWLGISKRRTISSLDSLPSFGRAPPSEDFSSREMISRLRPANSSGMVRLTVSMNACGDSLRLAAIRSR